MKPTEVLHLHAKQPAATCGRLLFSKLPNEIRIYFPPVTCYPSQALPKEKKHHRKESESFFRTARLRARGCRKRSRRRESLALPLSRGDGQGGRRGGRAVQPAPDLQPVGVAPAVTGPGPVRHLGVGSKIPFKGLLHLRFSGASGQQEQQAKNCRKTSDPFMLRPSCRSYASIELCSCSDHSRIHGKFPL